MARRTVGRAGGALALSTVALGGLVGGLVCAAGPALALGPVPAPPAVSAVTVLTEVTDEAVDAVAGEVLAATGDAPAPTPAPAPEPSDDPVTAALPEPVKGLAAPVTRPVLGLVLGTAGTLPLPTPAPDPSTPPGAQPVAPRPPAPAGAPAVAPVVAPVAPVAVSLPRVDDTTVGVVVDAAGTRPAAASASVTGGGPRTAPLTFPRPLPPAAVAFPDAPVAPGLPAAVVALAIGLVTAAGAGQLAEVRARR